MESKLTIYFNGDKRWVSSSNLLHREDGSALEFANGEKYWFYHDIQIHCKDNEEFLKLIKLKAF